MPLLQPRRLDRELIIRIPDHEIGIVSRRNPPLARRQPGKRGRRFTHPASDVADAVATIAGLGPHCGEPEFDRRDAAPGPDEISWAFQRWRGGRVIADHHFEHAGTEAAPQRFAMIGGANRRCALVLRGSIRNGVCGKREVMRTRFGGDRYAQFLVCGNHVNRFSR